MLKRLWFVISALWAAALLTNGSTREHGIQEMDWALALAPFLLGWFIAGAGCFVVTGSVLKARDPRVVDAPRR